MHRRIGIVVALLAGATLLSGCSNPSSSPSPSASPSPSIQYTQVGGFPTWAMPADPVSAQLQAFAHDDELAIVLWGSSSCPPTPTALSPGTVPVITFETVKHEICTDDMAPTSYVFPDAELGGSAPAQVTVTIDGRSSTLEVRHTST